jgi:hypothetical protein
MRKDAERRHHEVLDMIEKLSEATASERASMVINLVCFNGFLPTVSQISGNHYWSSNRYIIHFPNVFRLYSADFPSKL